MASKIILKKSAVSGKVPVLADLEFGEVALNYADGALFYKKADNTIQNLITSGGGGGSGTVTSIGISVPTGLSVSNTPITTSGTIAISLTTGYSIPTTTLQGQWSTAYSWGDHASAGYQAALVSGTNIKTINGTSLLGSGDITISGGGGSGITNTIVTATAQTASVNTRYILTASTTSTLTLPSTPTQGDTVYVLIANGLATNIIARNSEKIMGIAEDMVIDNSIASFGLIYINSTLGWRFL